MSKPDAAPPPSLVFEWKHRPVTWLRLTFFVFLALVAHVACFYVFSVRMPLPTRAVPVPASITLASSLVSRVDDPAVSNSTNAAIPLPTTGLDLPEMPVTDPYEPSFKGHVLPRPGWPARPHRAAWPEITGASRVVLPPAPPPTAAGPPPPQ